MYIYKYIQIYSMYIYIFIYACYPAKQICMCPTVPSVHQDQHQAPCGFIKSRHASAREWWQGHLIQVTWNASNKNMDVTQKNWLKESKKDGETKKFYPCFTRLRLQQKRDQLKMIEATNIIGFYLFTSKQKEG